MNVDDFVSYVEEQFNRIDKVETESVEYGQRIRAYTNINGDQQETYKEKLLELQEELMEEKKEKISKTEEIVAIRLDWMHDG